MIHGEKNNETDVPYSQHYHYNAPKGKKWVLPKFIFTTLIQD